jgi:hypothetical protein
MKKTILAVLGFLALTAAAHAATVWNFYQPSNYYSSAAAKVVSGTPPPYLATIFLYTFDF